MRCLLNISSVMHMRIFFKVNKLNRVNMELFLLKMVKKPSTDHSSSILIAHMNFIPNFTLLIVKIDLLDPFQSKYFVFFSSKISIWVLRRTVLTSWLSFSLIKTHWRSCRTQREYIIEIDILFTKRFPN